MHPTKQKNEIFIEKGTSEKFIIKNIPSRKIRPFKRLNLFSSNRFLLSQNLHQELVQTLVRSGLDQCKAAIRKLTSKRCYKSYKHTMTGKTIIPFARDQDMREFKLDALGTAVDDLVARIRNLSLLLADEIAEPNSDDDTFWFNPFSETMPATQQTLIGSPSGIDFHVDDIDPFDRMNRSPLNMHPFAHFKQKKERGKTHKRKRSKLNKKSVGFAVKRSIDSPSGSAMDIEQEVHPHQYRGADSAKEDLIKDASSTSFSDSGEVENDTIAFHPLNGDRILAARSKDLGSNSDSDENLPLSSLSALDRSQNRRAKKRKPAKSQMQKSGKRQVTERSKSNQENIMTEIPSVTRNAMSSVESDHENEPVTLCTDFLVDDPCDGVTFAEKHDQIPKPDQLEAWLEATDEDPELSRASPRKIILSIEHNNSSECSSEPSETRGKSDCPHGDRSGNNGNIASLAFSGEETVEDLCRSLVAVRSISSSKLILERIIRQSQDCALQNGDAAYVFQSIIDVLRADGSRTLQDYISNEDKNIERVVIMLSVALKLIKEGVNDNLNQDDGLVFKIFGPCNSEKFISWIILMLVDSVMSMFHPVAWNISVQNRRRILLILSALRDAVACLINPTEAACQCLCTELGMQEWRCVRDGENVFVSSVDPDQWQSYLLSGEYRHTVQVVRLYTFSDYLPRCEVDSFWCSVAFFSQAKQSVERSDKTIWNILLSLPAKSSLYSTSASRELPPSREQAQAVVSELKYLKEIAFSGNLGELPKKDNLFFDIVQKALHIQADELLLNEQSQLYYSPSILDEKSDADFVSRIFEGIENPSSSSDPVGYLGSINLKCWIESGKDIIWMGKPLFLPFSDILCGCLSLLMSWIDRIPLDKPKRLKCFENALKIFVKNLIDQCTECNLTNHENDSERRDAFAANFLSASESSKRFGASLRNTFLRESASHMVIFSSLATALKTKQNILNCVEDVWNILADDETMKKRLEWIISECNQPRPENLFRGENFHLLITVKALSCLILTVIGRSSSSEERFPTEIFNTRSVKFFLSCLLACLDCSSDIANSLESQTCLLCCVVTVLNRLRQWTESYSASSAPFDPGYFFNKLVKTRTVHRAFNVVINTTVGSEMEKIYIQLLVALLHISVKFVPIKLQQTEITVDDEDDLFGGIDDSVLANIDVGTGKQHDPFSTVSDYLFDLLMNAKCSSRNAIITGTLTQFPISTQGMRLVASVSNVVCACYVDVVIRANLLFRKLWTLPIIIAPNDQGDTNYFKQLACICVKKLCRYQESSVVHEVVRRDKEFLFFILITSLLDESTLRKIPSNQFLKIGSKRGPEAEKRAFIKLVKFNRNNTLTGRIALNELEIFCGQLGRLFSKVEKTGIYPLFGMMLLQFHGQQNSRQRNIHEICLERECLRRFHMIRDFLRVACTASGDQVVFERLSCLVLASASSQLVLLLQKWGIWQKACQDLAQNDLSLAKLSETVSCYEVLFVSLLAYIFRLSSSRSMLSGAFHTLLLRISDRFISPLLSNQVTNFLSSLQEISSMSVMVLEGTLPCLKQRNVVTSTFDVKSHVDVVRDLLIERSRDIMLIISANKESGLSKFSTFLMAFVASGIRGKKEASSMANRAFSLRLIMIDYFSVHKEEQKLSTTEQERMSSLKHHVLRRILVTKLNSSFYKVPERTGVVWLLQGLLDLQHEESMTTLDSLLLCNIARSVRISINVALLEWKVDEELISASFSCARSLINLPAASVSKGAVGWLVDWVYSMVKSGGEQNQENMHAKYIWNFCLWLKDFGEAIVDKDSFDRLNDFRKRLNGQEQTFSSWPSFPNCTFCLSEVEDLEGQIFPSISVNGTKISNMYVVRSRTQGSNNVISEPLESWIPGATLRSTVGQFTSKIKFAVSTGPSYSQ
jgi:hypothetical protein